MGESRVRRVVAGTAGAALLAASFLVALPGGASVTGPRIIADVNWSQPPDGGPPDHVFVDGMTPGEAIHIAVDFAPADVTDVTANAYANEFGQYSTTLATSGYLRPGTHITVTGTDTDPDWVEDLWVEELRIEYADPYADRVAGIATMSATVQVEVYPAAGGGPLVQTQVTADATTGWWSVDLRDVPFDLQQDQLVMARVADGDGDLSQTGTEAQRPIVQGVVDAGPAGYVLLNGWPEGTPVTVEVDYEDNGSVDDMVQVLARKFGPGIILSGDNGVLHLGSSIAVTADNGAEGYHWVKELIVEPLSIDDVDLANDWLGGTAPPNRALSVEIQAQGPSPSTRQTTSDPSGLWSADFTGADGWDLQPGTGVTVYLPEDGGDDDVSGLSYQVASSQVTLNAWPTDGLWDGAPIDVFVSEMPPNSTALLSVNVASDPFDQFVMLPGVPVDEGGWGQTTVQVPRFVGEVDCAAAPGTCILVTADPFDPFERHASVPLAFGRLDLFRYDLNDPNDPWAGGTVGDPIGSLDEVAHNEWIWVQGTGFSPGPNHQLGQCKDVGGTEVCRTTWTARPSLPTDEQGSFGTPLQVGRNVLGGWNTEPQVWVEPSFDLRDGQTVVVGAEGLPPEDWIADCGPGECWIGARSTWADDGTTHIRSDPLTFSGDPMPITVEVSQILVQQLEVMVHIGAAVGPDVVREVSWDRWTGTLFQPYTATERWLEPDLTYGPYSPEPVEHGFYDCADTLAFDPETGAREPVHCAMALTIREGDDPGFAFFGWSDVQFARFDLSATVATSGTLSPKPSKLTVSGDVTCTGFMLERYPVTIEGTVTQVGGTIRRPTVVTRSFSTTVDCSGTMTNPGRARWTVDVPGGFKPGIATVEIDAWSPGFTMTEHPVHVATEITITGTSKGKP